MPFLEAEETAPSTQNGGSHISLTTHPIDTEICMVYLCYKGLVTRSSRIFIQYGGFLPPGVPDFDERGHLFYPKRPPTPVYIKNRESRVTSPNNKDIPHKIWCQSDE